MIYAEIVFQLTANASTRPTHTQPVLSGPPSSSSADTVSLEALPMNLPPNMAVLLSQSAGTHEALRTVFRCPQRTEAGQPRQAGGPSRGRGRGVTGGRGGQRGGV